MRNTQTVAAMGAFRQQTRMYHRIANNLSNVQTVGFKRQVPVFQTILSKSAERFQNIPNDTIRISFLPGPIQKTGNDLDLAIEGEGFFKVKTPNGIRYTRGGNFTMNKDKVLINAFKPADDGDGWIVRLFGASGKTERVRLKWSKPEPGKVWLSDTSERPKAAAGEEVEVPAWGLVTLRAQYKNML